MKPALTLGVLAAALAMPATGQDIRLDLSPDPSPDGEVIFALTLPYQLNDLDPDVTTFGYHCRISIGVPRDEGGATLSFTNHIENVVIMVNTNPLSADGYRDVSGTMSLDIPVPYSDVEKLLLPGARGNYRCEPRLGMGGPDYNGNNVARDEANNLSYPAAVRGTGNGYVGGDILVPATGSSSAMPAPAKANTNIDPSKIKPPSKLPTSPLFRKDPN
ncbi:hypothetical protein [Henriciella litoralis]|uniref:hypothetical protein n=1 Tax=Henriciella litoralis TaxID=568102 RepID=UPI00111C22B8|nr:hypothetical protein [Henriciella litoralis]